MFIEDIKVNFIYWWNKHEEDVLDILFTLLIPVLLLLVALVSPIAAMQDADDEWREEHGIKQYMTHREIRAMKRELKRQEKEEIRQELRRSEQS